MISTATVGRITAANDEALKTIQASAEDTKTTVAAMLSSISGSGSIDVRSGMSDNKTSEVLDRLNVVSDTLEGTE